MKRLACASLLLPLCLVVAVVRAEDKVPDSPWYPLQRGNTWHYRAGDSKFQIRVAGQEKVGDVLCARLEMVKDGKVGAVEWIGVTADGIYRYRVEIPRGDQKVVETPRPSVLLLRLPPKKGDTFTVDSKAEPSGKVFKGTFKIGEEEIKVGDKTYKAFVVSGQDLEGDGLKPGITTWYAENVGMVKQVIAAADQKIEIELEKFGKGSP